MIVVVDYDLDYIVVCIVLYVSLVCLYVFVVSMIAGQQPLFGIVIGAVGC